MPQETLTRKALNRALLARQMLLAREEASTLAVIEHLVGLQAQLARHPDADERAMGYAVRTHLPLVLVPREHEWGFSGDADFALADEWLSQHLETEDRPHALVLRYLAAFGPASATDIQAWSGLAGIAPVLSELRPQLQVFRDERRRELFDLLEAPRPPEEMPVPARLVADFDNLILS